MALLREREWKGREMDRQNAYSRDNKIEKRDELEPRYSGIKVYVFIVTIS